MQLPIPVFRGQNKPGGIPRINWSHPMARGLTAYIYDCNGVYLDLVQGGIGKRGNVANMKIGTYRYGSGFQQLGTAAAPAWVNMPTSRAAFLDGQTLPFSLACGTFYTAALAGGASLGNDVAVAGAAATDTTFNSGPFFLAQLSVSTHFSIAWNNGATINDYATLIAPNTFQTWLAVATGSTTASLYANGKLDSSITGISSTTNTIIGGAAQYCISTGGLGTDVSGGGILGFLPYFAFWNRQLTAADALQLHLDPYCFLSYVEDEMFAMIGGTAVVIPPAKGNTLPLMGVG